MTFDLPGVEPGSDIESLFKAVGFIAVQWGFVEQSLDLMLASIISCFDGDPLLEKRPQNLKPKVKLLRKCFTKFPELKQFSYESVGLLKRFLDIGEKRNDLMHGAIANISAKDSAFKFLKVDVSPNNQHSARLVYLRDEEWTEFRRKLIRLGKEEQALAQRVEKRLRIHHP
jgi:hypothetical protein